VTDENVERAIEAARLDGFQQGLAARDEQIRTNTLPHPDSVVVKRERLLTPQEARQALSWLDEVITGSEADDQALAAKLRSLARQEDTDMTNQPKGER
jgi:hypothetical protein